ncbi:MAG: hypothetical protein ACLGI6_13430 [Gammaproteobacteria bacterium]
MELLSELVNLLSAYVDDTIPVPEAEIRQFAQQQNIPLRSDHLQLLMRFGCPLGARPSMFAQYGGDFDFDLLKSVYLDNFEDTVPPPGTTFFGSNFVGDTYCIDATSGKIFVYDGGERFGQVHEAIDGFLLTCLLSAYDKKAFANKIATPDLAPEQIESFRLGNEKHKLSDATYYQSTYDLTATPKTVAEYYFLDRQLIVLYPSTYGMVTLRGGVVDQLTD